MTDVDFFPLHNVCKLVAHMNIILIKSNMTRVFHQSILIQSHLNSHMTGAVYVHHGWFQQRYVTQMKNFGIEQYTERLSSVAKNTFLFTKRRHYHSDLSQSLWKAHHVLLEETKMRHISAPYDYVIIKTNELLTHACTLEQQKVSGQRRRRTNTVLSGWWCWNPSQATKKSVARNLPYKWAEKLHAPPQASSTDSLLSMTPNVLHSSLHEGWWICVKSSHFPSQAAVLPGLSIPYRAPNPHHRQEWNLTRQTWSLNGNVWTTLEHAQCWVCIGGIQARRLPH